MEAAALLLQVLNLIALFVLVILTGWYARSTSKTVKELRRQVDSSSRQSELLAKSAQVSAWAALTRAAGHPSGQNPIDHLRRLVAELEALSAPGGKPDEEEAER